MTDRGGIAAGVKEMTRARTISARMEKKLTWLCLDGYDFPEAMGALPSKLRIRCGPRTAGHFQHPRFPPRILLPRRACAMKILRCGRPMRADIMRR